MPVSQISTNNMFSMLDHLAMTVAASRTFQRMVGAANQLEAMEHSHTYAAVRSFGQVAPFAVVTGLEMSFENQGTGSWFASGNPRLFIEWEYPDPQTAQEFEDVKRQFISDLSAMWSDLQDLESQPNPLTNDPQVTFINIQSFNFIEEPWMESAAERAIPDLEAGEEQKCSWNAVFQLGVF